MKGYYETYMDDKMNTITRVFYRKENDLSDNIPNEMYRLTGLTAIKDDDNNNPTYTLWDKYFIRPVAEHLSVAELKSFAKGYIQAKGEYEDLAKCPVEVQGKNHRKLFRVDGLYGYEDQFIWADDSDEALKIARTICPKYNGTQVVFNPKDMNYGDWLNKVNDISAK